ncbi:MAG: sialidase family protein [bacterium]
MSNANEEGVSDTGVKPTVNVRLRERQVLFVAPDTEGTRKWGVYGCPDMYRAADGSIVVYDPGNMDTYDRDAGAMVEPVAFRSVDNGKTWESVASQEYGRPAKVFTLSDGAQVQFRTKSPPVDLRAAGLRPEHIVITPNECGLLGLFRHGDIPLAARTFEVRYREAGATTWLSSDGVFDMPELYVGAVVKGKTDAAVWPDVTPNFDCLDYTMTGLHMGCTGQEALVEADDGVWISAIYETVPTERNARYFAQLHCIASADKGRTWRGRGCIFDLREQTTFGATEEFSMIRQGSEIVCVDRTDCATTFDPHRGTVLARSADNGFTWSKPEVVASSSVTPHLVRLGNGVAALVFGRPGVHVQFSSDGCRSWNALTSLIGKTKEEELAAGRDLMDAMYIDTVSYSNTRTVTTGPDRFLVLYTDFKYEGQKRKALVVQEVMVAPVV